MVGDCRSPAASSITAMGRWTLPALRALLPLSCPSSPLPPDPRPSLELSGGSSEGVVLWAGPTEELRSLAG